jgi:tRNA A-37 threonylcarbamoyl transferase component Bud32
MSEELRSGRYVLVTRLGEGSQGETWEAIDRGESRKRSLNEQWEKYVEDRGKKAEVRPPSTKGERLVAIKAFRMSKAKAWKDVELAEREAKTLQALKHPNLPKYIEHFEEDGALYLVMEKIEGESLAAIKKSKRALAPNEIERLLGDLAKALEYLHGHAPPVVHRDIKPGNVIRRPDGSFALVDFGAVRDRLKPAGGSTVVGTFGYMAPEQFQGRASPKSDVYGAAATALAMLTGEEPEDLPHEGLALDVRKAVPSSTPKALVRALEAMLEPDPDRRAGSIAEALAERPRAENRKQRRAERKRREREEEPVVERTVRPAPILARVFARLGLLVALLAVWLAVGMFTPLVLVLLSLFFGQRLRDAARACVNAAKRAQGAIGRASARLGGRIVDPPKLRVADFDRVRAVTEPEAQALAARQAEARGEDVDAWLEEKLEGEQRRFEEQERRKAQMKQHAQRKRWGR